MKTDAIDQLLNDCCLSNSTDIRTLAHQARAEVLQLQAALIEKRSGRVRLLPALIDGLRQGLKKWAMAQ